MGTENMAKGPLDIRRASGRETSSSPLFGALGSGARGSSRHRRSVGGRHFHSVEIPARWQRANETGPGKTGSAASSAGNSRPCRQGSLWVAAAPCTEKTRRAPEHSRHFLWLGACWQVTGAEQHRKWLRGPKGWFMKQDEYHCYQQPAESAAFPPTGSRNAVKTRIRTFSFSAKSRHRWVKSQK